MASSRRNKMTLPLGLIEGGEVVDGRHVYLHGNYDHYYGDKGWRATGGSESALDGRLAAILEFDSDLFKGKRVLDVGCNRGVLAVAAAGVLNAQYVVGIDIDVKLVDSAIQSVRSLKALQRIRRSRRAMPTTYTGDGRGTSAGMTCAGNAISKTEDSHRSRSNVGDVCTDGLNDNSSDVLFSKNVLIASDNAGMSVSTGTDENVNVSECISDNSIGGEWCQLPMHLKSLDCCLPRSDASYVDYGFPANLEFRAENFVLDSTDLRRRNELPAGVWTPFDLVFLFSVTKWIHYHHGDAGIKKVFHTAHRLLKPGGIMILEPQSWDAYRKKRRLREDIKNRVSRALLKPHFFSQYLTMHRKYNIKCGGSTAERSLEHEPEWMNDEVDERYNDGSPLFDLITVLQPLKCTGKGTESSAGGDGAMQGPSAPQPPSTFDRPIFIYRKADSKP
eukprot:Lankesteria_metandrocarpae@DN2535_c0_g1_i1.p1